jgi:hypothetical protein
MNKSRRISPGCFCVFFSVAFFAGCFLARGADIFSAGGVVVLVLADRLTVSIFFAGGRPAAFLAGLITLTFLFFGKAFVATYARQITRLFY